MNSLKHKAEKDIGRSTKQKKTSAGDEDADKTQHFVLYKNGHTFRYFQII